MNRIGKIEGHYTSILFTKNKISKIEPFNVARECFLRKLGSRSKRHA